LEDTISARRSYLELIRAKNRLARLGVERDVADLVDDQERDPSRPL
jgi:hypothetical protein